MGWLFKNHQSREALVRDLIRTEETTDGAIHQCLRHTLRGNVLWTVWELTRLDGSMWRFIGCDLLESGGSGWGYKALSESVGPFYYTCPPAYLEMVPEANAVWREKIRGQHRDIPVGSRVTFDENLKIPYGIVIRVTGRTLVVSYGGRLYKVPPRFRPHITRVDLPENARIAS